MTRDFKVASDVELAERGAAVGLDADGLARPIVQRATAVRDAQALAAVMGFLLGDAPELAWPPCPHFFVTAFRDSACVMCGQLFGEGRQW